MQGKYFLSGLALRGIRQAETVSIWSIHMNFVIIGAAAVGGILGVEPQNSGNKLTLLVKRKRW